MSHGLSSNMFFCNARLNQQIHSARGHRQVTETLSNDTHDGVQRHPNPALRQQTHSNYQMNNLTAASASHANEPSQLPNFPG
jgi:hypothetical protein